MAEYTLLQSGDPDAAENFGAADGDIDRGGIVSGVALSNYDSAAPSIDVAAGKTVHILDTATAEWTLDDSTQKSEQRDKVQVVAHVDTQTVTLDDGAVNELFVDPNWDTTDSPQVKASTSGAPNSESEKIGEVDTSADEVSERWGVIEEDGTLSYPDNAAANAALSSLPDGVVVIDRTNGVRMANGGISVPTLEADYAIVNNRDVSQYITDLQIGLGEQRFNSNLEKLNYDGGWFDVLEDESLVDTKTNVVGFTGSVTTTSSSDSGQFSSPFQTLDFVPSSVVIGHDVDVQNSVIVENGEQINYDIPNDISVSDAELILTGQVNTDSVQQSYQGLVDGSTRTLNIGGSEPADVQIEMSTPPVGVKEWENSRSSGYGTASPAISNGTVYFGHTNGSVYAVDASTGNEEWSFATNDAISYPAPTISNGIVYIGSQDGNVYALDASTGTKEWSYDTGYRVETTPVVSNGTVYIASVGGMYAFDADTGTVEWDYTGSSSFYSSPTLSNGVVFFGALDGVLHARDASNGNEVWTFQAGDGIRASSPAVSNGIVYVGARDSKVYAVDASTGNEEWSYATGAEIYQSSPTVSNGTVYIGSDDGSMYALDASTGSKEWSFATGRFIYSSPTVSDDVVYFGNGDGNVYALDASTGNEEWTFVSSSNSLNTIPAISNGTLYIGGSDALYAIKAVSEVTDPSVSIGTKEVAYTGTLTGSDRYSGTLSDITTGTRTLEVTTNGGEFEVTASWTETTETIDPSVTIDSDAGSQTVDYVGNLSDGSSVDLSSEVDSSLIDGSVTVSITVSNNINSPVGKVGIEYQHDNFDAGGFVKYTIEDSDGNNVTVKNDENVDVSFTSSDLRVVPKLRDGFAEAELLNYSVYFQ